MPNDYEKVDSSDYEEVDLPDYEELLVDDVIEHVDITHQDATMLLMAPLVSIVL